MDSRISEVTERIRRRSAQSRADYLRSMRRAAEEGPRRGHLSCGNQAHAYAAMEADKGRLAGGKAPNLGIITAYNDMLSAHQPFATFPATIKRAARSVGATAQVAGGVPAMCDGVTQGQQGMELSLFSRDVIALASAVALSHNVFDAAVFLGVCDKIVPGMVIAALTFGHLPAVFIPAGPMTSGLPNDEKARIRQRFAAGEIDRGELMRAEMDAYHGPGTCTFYGTANSNQMLMEFMGLHLPGASFVNPGTPLRQALTEAAAVRAVAITSGGNDFRPVGRILDERSFVNGIVGLMATGGSTNLVLHLTAMARAGGIHLDTADFAAISDAVPLLARVYPNGLADVNHLHAAGGLSFLIRELLDAGLLHKDARTISGDGLQPYTREPRLQGGDLVWEDCAGKSENEKIIRPAASPFAATGGLRQLQGNLGRGVIKISAVKEEHRVIEAPVRLFSDQVQVMSAFQKGELDRDCLAVIRFQGPGANGMPELHSLTPVLSVLLDRGHRVGLITDGRMSGASGKVPAAIHMSPEAAAAGPLARLRDGDIVRLDADAGRLNALNIDISSRDPQRMPASDNVENAGQRLFGLFREHVGSAESGAFALATGERN